MKVLLALLISAYKIKGITPILSPLGSYLPSLPHPRLTTLSSMKHQYTGPLREHSSDQASVSIRFV